MKFRVTRITSLLTLLVLALAARGNSAGPMQAVSTGLPAFSRNAAGFMDLSVKQLAESMSSKNFTLVNVHVPHQEDLPGTNLSIPFDKITASLDKLPGKEAPIVLYCRSGAMSTEAAAALAAAGYTKIYELDGGFNAWKAAGYKIVSK